LGEKQNKRGFRVFSNTSKELAVAYAQKRLRAGATTKEVSDELGLNGWTLQRWLQRERGARKANAGFTRVGVASATRVSAVVRGPCGVWVEGLGIDDIAALMRSLSCSA
jgi:hypothetical protein